MNITQKSTGELSLQISLQVVESDYADEVKKSLNQYRKQANIPGFRPGMVPFGMIKKQYGEAVIADVVSNLIGEQLDKYIKEQKLIVLLNKIDLPKAHTKQEIQKHLKGVDILAISAKEKQQLDKLEDKLIDIIQKEKINSNIIISNIRHYEALKKAQKAIDNVKNSLSDEIPSDLLAMDLREAIRFIGEITGNISDNEILRNIFANFCIGK